MAGQPLLPYRRMAVRLAPTAFLFLAAGCAHTFGTLDDPFAVMADSVIGAGFTHISQRYLEPVPMEEIAIDSMGVVTRFDPDLKVVRDKDEVLLEQGDATLHSYALPKGQAPGPWAEVTTDLLEDGRLASPKMHDMDPEQIYSAVFSRALSHLDRFSRYAAPGVAREQRAQRDGFGGIGVALKQDGDDIKVEAVFEETPAAKLGIAAGDVLIAVDGQPVKGIALTDIVDRLRGPVNSTVKLTLARGPERSPRDVTVGRALIIPTTVIYVRNGDIAYIRITSFNQDTGQGLHKALEDAIHDKGPPLHGIVLDLRDNPGGLLDQAIEAADVFLAHGRILSTSGRHPDSNQTFDASGADEAEGRPVAILINENTASAAEILAAALQDQGRAILVGATSYGKGTVQTVHRLPNDGELVITWSRIHAPSGYSFNQVGVIPNVCTSKVPSSDPADTAAAVLDMVKSGRLDTMPAREALRAAPDPSKSEIRLLRASCPPRSNDPKLDLQVATRILEDQTLLANALAPVGSPELAKRP